MLPHAALHAGDALPVGINATLLLRWAATFTNFAEQKIIGWDSRHHYHPCVWTGIICRPDGLYSIDLSNFNLTLGMSCLALLYKHAAASISLLKCLLPTCTSG